MRRIGLHIAGCLQLVAIVAGALAGGGCALTVEAVNPRPNVDLPASRRTLLLKMDPSIQEDFDIPSQNGILGAQFVGFRTSLKRGFKAAFREFYPAPDAQAKPDLTLLLVQAEPSFAATAVGVNRYGVATGAAAASAQLNYKARLVDAAGKVVGRSNGMVTAKTSFTNRWEAQESVRQAMETMYEKIAAELLTSVPDPAVPPPPPAEAAPPPMPAAPPSPPPTKAKASKRK